MGSFCCRGERPQRPRPPTRSFLSDRCYLCDCMLYADSCMRCRYDHVAVCRRRELKRTSKLLFMDIQLFTEQKQWSQCWHTQRILNTFLVDFNARSDAERRRYLALPVECRGHAGCPFAS